MGDDADPDTVGGGSMAEAVTFFPSPVKETGLVSLHLSLRTDVASLSFQLLRYIEDLIKSPY